MKFALQRKHYFWAFVALVFLVVLLLTSLTPLLADDYNYGQGNTSLAAIVQRETSQYFNWGGRSLAHLTARIFLALPKVVFNICNALVYTGLTLMLYKMAHPHKAYRISLYLFIVASLFLFLPVFGQSNLWLTGSCNYLWGTANIVLLLFLYDRFICGKNEKSIRHPIWLAAGMLLLGLTAGWRNENTSGGAVMLVTAYILYAKFTGRKMQLWMFTGLGGTLIGLALMVLAPGNRARMAASGTDPARPFFAPYATALEDISAFIQNDLTVLLVLFVILTATLLVMDKNWQNSFFPLAGFLTFLAVCYVLVLVGSSSMSARAYHGAVTFLVLAAAQSFAALPADQKPLQVLSFSFSMIVTVQSLFALLPAVSSNMRVFSKYREREDYIQIQKAAGNLNPLVTFIESTNPYTGLFELGDIYSDPNYWTNHDFAGWHGLESVRSVEVRDWLLIYENGDPALMNCFDYEKYPALLASGDYFVAVTASTDGSGLLDERLAGMLQQMGFLPDAELAPGDSYVAIAENGTLLVEQTGSGTVSYNDYYLGTTFQLTANAAGDGGLYADICIGNIEYARNQPGVNIVVVDPARAQVLDSVAFTAGASKVTAYR